MYYQSKIMLTLRYLGERQLLDIGVDEARYYGIWGYSIKLGEQ
jgi:hypothetical protein